MTTLDTGNQQLDTQCGRSGRSAAPFGSADQLDLDIQIERCPRSFRGDDSDLLAHRQMPYTPDRRATSLSPVSPLAIDRQRPPVPCRTDESPDRSPGARRVHLPPLTPRSTNLATTSDALTAEMIPPLKRRAATSAPFSSNAIASSAELSKTTLTLLPTWLVCPPGTDRRCSRPASCIFACGPGSVEPRPSE